MRKSQENVQSPIKGGLFWERNRCPGSEPQVVYHRWTVHCGAGSQQFESRGKLHFLTPLFLRRKKCKRGDGVRVKHASISYSLTLTCPNPTEPYTRTGSQEKAISPITSQKGVSYGHEIAAWATAKLHWIVYNMDLCLEIEHLSCTCCMVQLVYASVTWQLSFQLG